jgi:hypothetical protein
MSKAGELAQPITVYVQLMGEGTTVYRPTQATPVGSGLVRLLATEDYDPDDEDWEFKPRSVVKIQKHVFSGGTKGYLAISLAK